MNIKNFKYLVNGVSTEDAINLMHGMSDPKFKVMHVGIHNGYNRFTTYDNKFNVVSRFYWNSSQTLTLIETLQKNDKFLKSDFHKWGRAKAERGYDLNKK
jgi:hypothetical protein